MRRMPIEPVKIPQNVQIEDRIIGPVTLRQLIITIIGCGISYAIWSSLQKMFGAVGITVTVVAWIPAVIFIAFAFIKVYNLSLLRIVFLMLERSIKPQIRTWAPRPGIGIINPHALAKPEKKKPAAVQEQPQSIEELSSMLDIPDTEAPPPPSTTAEHDTDPPAAAASSPPMP